VLLTPVRAFSRMGEAPVSVKTTSEYSISAEEVAKLRARFPLDMSPEEYAARNAHRFLLFGFELLDLQAPDLQAWLLRVADIMFGRNGAPSLQELRRKYLSDSEIADIEREMHEDP
jgi:hypothetical protein